MARRSVLIDHVLPLLSQQNSNNAHNDSLHLQQPCDCNYKFKPHHKDDTRRWIVISALPLSAASSAAAAAGLYVGFWPVELVKAEQQEQQQPSLVVEPGLLEARLMSENNNAVQSPPPYGMEGLDIFYPSWFLGTWNVSSITARVEAPCGVALFGGNATFQAAKLDIGNELKYQCRFLAAAAAGSKTMATIADREFNVQSIAKAAMGENSVLDIPLATPNKFTCILAPPQGTTYSFPLRVDLVVLNRRQETISNNRFDCAEVVREIISPLQVGNSKKQPQYATAVSSSSSTTTTTSPILKEIETISSYTYNEAKDEISCLQRTAAFLLPSQQSPLAMKMWQASQGRPVDMRFYNVVYTKQK